MNSPPVALGFRDHTGWAVAIAATMDGSGVRVLHRDRLTLLDAGLPAQVYHASQGMPLDAARASIAEVLASSRHTALEEVEQLISILDIGGFRPSAAAIPLSPAVPTSLERILAGHTTLHAAEGALYRDVLEETCSALGLRVTRYDPREAASVACAVHGLTPGALQDSLAALGKQLGPPWRADHKLATAAALIALR
ncbi:MAG: hypothetical protein WEC33_04430 [Dehalococcoidia bacterium]